MKKVGLIIGKFLPIHNGHLFFINKAATQMDKLIVIVDENPTADKKIAAAAGIKYPDLLTRTKWMTSIFKDADHVEVVAMSEEGISEPPLGWKEWSDRVKETVKDLGVTHIYTSDSSYKEGYDKYFPEWQHVFFDNERAATDGISATQVRSDMTKYWGKLPSVVRAFYTKKICLIGGESVGKTTLVRAMAKAFGTSWSEEYGRAYCENEIGSYYDHNGFLLTDKSDYEKIVIEQEHQNEKAFRTANVFALIDTDAIYTQYFYEKQFGETNELIEQMIKRQKEDYIYIFISGDVPFVDDGYRTGHSRDEVKKFYSKYISFDYEINASTHEERFDQVYEILKGEIWDK